MEVTAIGTTIFLEVNCIDMRRLSIALSPTSPSTVGALKEFIVGAVDKWTPSATSATEKVIKEFISDPILSATDLSNLLASFVEKKSMNLDFDS